MKPSTKGRRARAQLFLWIRLGRVLAQPVRLMWKVMPRTRPGEIVKRLIFFCILACLGNLARFGRLPRTWPIVPGEIAVSD